MKSDLTMTHILMKVLGGIFLIALIAGGSACSTTPDCERNNTGTLEVYNNDSRESEVRLDGSHIFTLEGFETGEHELSSGTHDIRCFTTGTEPAEVQDQVSITECETTSFDIEY